MSDLIPFGVLAFIVLLAYAMIREGRRQRAAKRKAFRDLAETEGLEYNATDDGRARAFARDFDGIGRFKSSSLGDVLPEDVVTGDMHGVDVVLFRHMTRFYEGYSQQWFVAGAPAPARIAARCSVQFLKKSSRKDTMYLPDPVVADESVGAFRIVVRSPDRASAGALLEDGILRDLARRADDLPLN